VTGLTDNFENIKKELIRCKKEFLNLFEDILHHRFDAKTFEVFDPTIDSIHRNLRPKISLVGFSGVGKTTITRLIKAEEIPMQHVPTITGDIATIKIGKLHFHLWDFAGQEQFSYLWNNFVKGSDAVLLITDSTLENVEKSKFFLELIKEESPNAHTAVIGNKQDLEDALKPEQIEKIIGLKTYSMIAKDPGNRDKMIQIIADVLEMSAEVSPLLKPLLERDELTNEATKAIEKGDFNKAALLFEKISDLCIELGDDSLGREFYEKAQKIKDMLKKVGATPAPEAPTEPKTPAAPAPVQPAPTPPAPEAPTEPKTPAAPAPVQPAPPPPAPEAPAAPKTPAAPAPVQPTPPPPAPEAPSKPASPQPSQVKPIKVKKPFSGIPGIPNFSIPIKKQKPIPKALSQANKSIKEQGVLIKPKIPQKNLGLQLNPEDFMIKQRPKTVSVVPKDARSKLKTSPYAHVTNPVELARSKSPVAPIKLMKEKELSAPKQTIKPATPTIPQQPSIQAKPEVPKQPTQPAQAPPISEVKLPGNVVDAQQRHNIEQTLMDLKIKKANIQKMALDFDMQELSGEITTEQLNQKKQRLEILEKKIEDQISNLEKLL